MHAPGLSFPRPLTECPSHIFATPNPKTPLISSHLSNLIGNYHFTMAATSAPKLATSSFASTYSSRIFQIPTPRVPSLGLTSSFSTPLRLNNRRTLKPRSSSSLSLSIAAAISVGDKLPEATLSYFPPEGDLKTVTVSELTKGKKAVLFAVPGAFTPTCSQKHLPGFVEKAGELRAKGVDTIGCVSVNDAFVMKAWREKLGFGDEVLLLSDGNGEFTKALGVELDLRDNPVGLGVRSRRYALLAEDGVVKVLNLEEGGAFTTSSAEDMLKAL